MTPKDSNRITLAEEDRVELVRLYEQAQRTPMLLVGSVDTSASAWRQVRWKMDELGKKYGFDPKAMRGITKATGEILL